MCGIFGGQSRDETTRDGDGAADAARHVSNPIAEIEVVGATVVATVTVTELADDTGAEQLASLLDDLHDSGALHFVLDISNVQYMNSACLGCLVQSLNRMARSGGRIALVNPAHSVQSLFRITRLESMFVVRPDVPEALIAVEGKPVED
jgi:anti-sigma B factor antagonist